MTSRTRPSRPEFFTGAIALLAILTLKILLTGITLSILWRWFIVPTFDLPALGVIPAIGVALTVTYMARDWSNNEEEKTFTEVLATIFITALLESGLILGVGWIVHLFM